MIDGGGVERAAQGPRHHILAFGPVLAAHVLVDADIAVIDEFGVHDGEDFLDLLARIAPGGLRRVIGGAGEEDRARACPLAHDDDGVEPLAVAHRDHDFAADIIGVGPHALVAGDHVGRHWVGLGEEARRCGCQQRQRRISKILLHARSSFAASECSACIKSSNRSITALAPRSSTGRSRKPKLTATKGMPAALAVSASVIESPTKTAAPPPPARAIASRSGAGSGLRTASVSPPTMDAKRRSQPSASRSLRVSPSGLLVQSAGRAPAASIASRAVSTPG